MWTFSISQVFQEVTPVKGSMIMSCSDLSGSWCQHKVISLRLVKEKLQTQPKNIQCGRRLLLHDKSTFLVASSFFKLDDHTFFFSVRITDAKTD